MRKKLFAVIMSVMMMVTFMPAMAFADVVDHGNTWTDDFSSVTYKDAAGNTKTSGAAREAVLPGGGTKGTVDAYEGYIKARAYKNTNVSAEAIDFNFASAQLDEVDVGNGDQLKWENAQKLMDGTVNVTKLYFDVPTYVDNYDGFDTAKEVTGKSFDNYTVTANISEYDEDNLYADQKLTVSYKITCSDQATAMNKIGMIKSITFTVKAKKADPKEAVYKVADALVDETTSAKNEVDDLKTLQIYYDGAAHEVQQVEMPGVTSKIEVWNAEKGSFEEASSAATVKDVDDYTFRATATDGKDPNTKTFYVKVVKSGSLAYQFNSIDVYGAGNIGYNVGNTSYTFTGNPSDPAYFVGSNYNPVDFVGVYEDDTAAKNKKIAFSKAIVADKESITAYFNDFYTINQTESQSDKGLFSAKVEDKDNSALSSLEQKALKTKHETLVGNYGEPSLKGTPKAKFYVKDEINFSKAPLNKTFKAKNGKLAKKRTFKVTAKAKSGAKVTYKLANGGSRITINKNTGKVTLKKGLKKRTYNVKITASAGTYVGTTKSFTCKIKVK